MAKTIKCKSCGEEIPKKIRKCPYCGKRNKKPIGLFIILFIVIVGIVSFSMANIKKKSERKVKYTWPSIGIATMIPAPDAKYGKIMSESEDRFRIDIYFISQKEYNEYVDLCKEKGFTVDYYGSDSYYSATDGDGNDLSIWYDNKNEEMSISINKKDDDTTVNKTNDTTEDTEKAEQESEEKEEISNSSTENAQDENVEFREWVDSYEKFMNKYIDFMATYDASDTTALGEYSELMSEYAQYMDKTNNLKEDDYSLSDWAYYMEAQARITEKMNKIQ